ncbi:unnamed protein product [Haemonchus placei]|uniref:Uncharacterized protein n=1 Tax=Haemonchus placei TaxID=6290 RepID=A0A0N4WVF3_HAEPC|nr:unnamed protein product [Haemonchus placei]
MLAIHGPSLALSSHVELGTSPWKSIRDYKFWISEKLDRVFETSQFPNTFYLIISVLHNSREEKDAGRGHLFGFRFVN